MLLSLTTQQTIAVNCYGSGEPIIFVNGFGSYQEIWAGQIATTIKAKFTVITWDYRGQGASLGEPATSLDQLADDLAALINQLQLQRPILIGHSMGCSVIWNLRQRHPEIAIKAEILVDQSPKMINTVTWPYGFVGIDETNWQTTYARRPQIKETLHGFREDVFEQFNHAKQAHPFDRAACLSLLKNHVCADWRATALAETVPVYFISARQSPYYRPGYGKWIAQQNRRTTEILVPNCGHDIMAEVPAAFNHALLNVLTVLRAY
ncbi:alpha/beta fold hydrolase [Lapidilactobacillus bayanensis]|uniref:alpha/beta fold hydrolase n=1 Tax=Lapidilactobacillus bayanensis TaxID=2485998 RepID=UPI000F7AAA5C|nr:alpha/beta hydrolase [Lapidilactobacillus bayanensis]